MKLTDEQKTNLASYVAGRRICTSKVRDYAMKAYGAEYTEMQISCTPKSKGLVYRRRYTIYCRRMNGCDHVLKNVRLTLDGLGDDVIVEFLDESTQRTDLSRCRTWGVGKVIRTNTTENISVNIMGFYPTEGTPVCSFPERGNSESFVDFLEKVRKANKDRTIVMILDSCRIHKITAALRAAEELNIRLCFPHPYSP